LRAGGASHEPVRGVCCDDAVVDVPETDVPLTGGRVARGVVRVGDTVRRPLTEDSERIHRLLAHFERRGFGAAPRFLGIDVRGREILTFIEGFAPPHNGFRLTEEAVAAGARLVRQVHDLTAGTEFAAGSEVACHPNLSQPNFIFRDMIPIAIIDWDSARPGTRVANLADFLWAFVHPAVYGDGEPAARMLRVAAGAYGWTGRGLVDAMLATVRNFVEVNPEFIGWGAAELAHMERNADLFRARLPG
jgi:Ser/Thr protein kinase RdoA (MazF antagonist)